MIRYSEKSINNKLMIKQAPYCCPTCTKESLKASGDGLICKNGHLFPYVKGTQILNFDCQDENVNEYSIKHAAEIHDNSLEWLLTTHHVSEPEFREDLLSQLHLKAGQKILITGAGTGNDLPYISNKIGNSGEIYAQDFSMQMLLAAYNRIVDKYGLSRENIHFSLSDAVKLPFKNNYFDAVYHFGGINIFSDIKRGILEMDRVVREGGRIVFGDEGLAPWLKETELGQMLITNNPLYNHNIPLQYLPATARDVQLNWTITNCYYIVSYTCSKDALPVNLDLPHKGMRGGTIRKRHLGVLEGIDPKLKASMYEKAREKGVSRVDFLERLLKAGLDADL